MRIACAALAILASAAWAEDQTPKPSFEVVSVRQGSMTWVTCPGAQVAVGGSVCGGPGTPDPERFTSNSAILKNLVEIAYGLQAFQVIGPGWIGTARYDIIAKVPPGATREQLNLMLQSLLEDRFKMKVHHETREFPGYDLVVAKGGLKLKEKVSVDSCSVGVRREGCPDGVAYTSGIAKSSDQPRVLLMGPREGGRIIVGRSTTFKDMARVLQVTLRGSVVTDQTGLTDRYDFRFEFSPPDVGSSGEFSAPSIFTALERELGLKLEAVKMQLDCIVIDQIEQPSEN